MGTSPLNRSIDTWHTVKLCTIKIGNCADSQNFRRQPDKLSGNKLSDVISAYRLYHDTNEIAETKNVHMDKEEVLQLNK